jgi:hypothetical protein
MPEDRPRKDESEDLHNQKLATLRDRFGPTDEHVLHAVLPVWMDGGQSSVHIFKEYVPGIAYITCDLIGWAGQKKNRMWKNYELLICTRLQEQLAPNMISRLAPYTLETAINPGETMDIGSAVPEGSSIVAFFFTTPEVRMPFAIQGIKSGVILCIGITDAELKARWKSGPEKLIETLKKGGVFPFTDWNRKSVV